MIMTEYALRLLSPCFNGGAQPMDLAELRVPSIRGQIRWWFRESASSSSARQQEEVCFGGVAGGNACKSSVIFRLETQTNSNTHHPLLPHKGQHTGSRPALPPQDFKLLCRCREDTFQVVDRALRLWVLLGGLGARSNRAAGAVWFAVDAPADAADLTCRLHGLNPPAEWDVQIAKIDSFAKGRITASDTVNGIENILGGIRPRKTSPIKLKLIDLSGTPHLLMYAPRKGMWEDALIALRSPLGGGHPKPLTTLDWTQIF